MNQHTPGPWRAVLYDSKEKAGYWPRPGEDGFLFTGTNYDTQITIHSTTENMDNVMGSGMGGHLADISPVYGVAGVEQAKANARLMAAAPDMLEALECAEKFISNGIEFGYITLPDKGDPALETLPLIRDVIARTKGVHR